MPNEIRAFGPVVEYKSETAFLTESPLLTMASDSYNKIPMIIGYTDREGMMFQKFFKERGENFDFPMDFQNLIPSYYNIPRNSPLSLKISDMMKNYYCGQGEPCEKNLDNIYIVSYFHGIKLFHGIIPFCYS